MYVKGGRPGRSPFASLSVFSPLSPFFPSVHSSFLLSFLSSSSPLFLLPYQNLECDVFNVHFEPRSDPGDVSQPLVDERGTPQCGSFMTHAAPSRLCLPNIH